MKPNNKLRLSVIAVSLVACAGIAGAQPVGGAMDGAEHHPDRAERRAEFQKRRAEMMARFDTNKDGKLDDAERTAMRDARATERFTQLDTNRDGVVTLAEFKAGRERFARDHHARRWFHGRDRK